ncbi:hypothetical protein L2829_00125 [Lactobacillus gasseri]|nr:hypothetical protein [Lactobacillus gasseri]
MERLNISSFAQLIKEAIGSTSDKETLELIFDTTIIPLQIKNNKNEYIDISASEASMLVNHQKDIKKVLQKLPKNNKEFNEVVSQMQQIVSEIEIGQDTVLKENLIHLIKNDYSLPAKQKKRLEEKSSSPLTEFLTYIYLDTLKLPNKLPDFNRMKPSEIINVEFPNRKINYSYYYSLLIGPKAIDTNKGSTVLYKNRLPGYGNQEIKNFLNSDPKRVFEIPAILGSETYSNYDDLYIARIYDFTVQEDGTMIIYYEKIAKFDRNLLLDGTSKDRLSDLASTIGISFGELNNTHWSVKKYDLAYYLKQNNH